METMESNHKLIKTSGNLGARCSDEQIQLGNGEKTALIFISSAFQVSRYTFFDLKRESNRYANAFQKIGLKAGEKALILIPNSPDLYFLFLGLLKLQVNCGIVFSNAGAATIRNRLVETGTKTLITTVSAARKYASLFTDPDHPVRAIVIDGDEMTDHTRGIRFLLSEASVELNVPPTHEETPSLFHFTSGSTGKPKAVQHVHGSAQNQRNSFREVIQPATDDVYWCTADPGWITGTTYGILAPWLNGVTQIQFAGGYSAKNWMKILEEQKVTLWYSAPTAFRMLMQNTEAFFRQFDLSALKRIYSIGEPLNPVIIEWGSGVLRKQIYDTWFQTETGSMMIANKPGVPVRPGSMGKPLTEIQAEILTSEGVPAKPMEKGFLCIRTPWASMFTAYIRHEALYQEKFKNGYYYSGDQAFKDEDGYFWFIGRNDDVINTAGHLVSPFEVESALLEMDEIADVGVTALPDPILFEKVVAFVKCLPGLVLDKKLELRIKLHVTNRVSSIACPRDLIAVDRIPKTRSGKIMRRVLRCSVSGEPLGDISTMEEE